MTDFQHLSLVTDDDGIATLTLDRPDRLNALTGRTIKELLAAFAEVDARDDVRAVVVTGAGRAFCSGIDMGGGERTFERKPGSNSASEEAPSPTADTSSDADQPAAKRTFIDISGPVALAIHRLRKPVIGAINGAAVGVGATLTLPMDIRLASTNARFSFPFARRGISPDACSSWFLPRIVGISRAIEWSLGGEFVSADDALIAGMLRSVHPADELIDAARAVARSLIAQSAPVSVAMIRRLMWRMLGSDDPAEAHRLESLALESRGASADAREGVRAFMQKRAPEFPDLVSTDLPDWFREWDGQPRGEQ